LLPIGFFWFANSPLTIIEVSLMKKSTGKVVFIIAGVGICLASILFAMRASLYSNEKSEEMRPINQAVIKQNGRIDQLIQNALSRIEHQPLKVHGYNMLCSAYLQKARETGDFSLNSRAEAAINQALEHEPDNIEAIKFKAILLLTFHRFNKGLAVARQAQQKAPRDAVIYGALVDALVELGRYEEADQAIKTMMSIRPDASSYSRLSYLYFLHGDNESAIELMQAAVTSSSPQDAEGLAWCRVHLGEELMKSRKLSEAERLFDLTLQELPDYHLALTAKARARLVAGDIENAIHFYQRAQIRVPLPDTAIALCNIYTKLGWMDEAKKQFDFVEFIEQSGTEGADTYSSQLALFWANHDTRLDSALTLMKHQRNLRRDIYTCDILAWCLFKKGQVQEAKAAIEEALRLGTQEAQIHYHAGMIYNALGDKQKATRHLQRALEIAPEFDIIQSDIAQQTLAALKK
jgi:pentatricopeptide repeat protein